MGPRVKRIQARYILIGFIFPYISNFLYIIQAAPLGIDPFPLFLPLTGTFLALGFYRYRIFDIRPVARDIVFEQMRDAVLVTNELGTIVDLNIAARKLFPSLSEGFNVRNLESALPALLKALNGNKADDSVSLSLPEGTRSFDLHHSRLSNRRGKTVGIAHVFVDITERVLMEERLSNLASTDELTGVANRRRFFEQARAELERARRYGRPFGVAILDLNNFKSINDTFGHPAGDEALRLAARLCEETLRSTDFMGRYGGDEFAFAFPECDETKTREAAERLARILGSTVFPYGTELIRLSASVGTAGGSASPLPDLEDLLKQADECMYRQKGRS